MQSKSFVNVDTTDIHEAMALADHNFEVEMVPLRLPNGQIVHDKKAVVRRDTGAYLGTNGKEYMPIQPYNFYEVAGEFIKQVPGARFNKVLNMREGAVMGVSITIGNAEYLPGDPVERNNILMNSFDGSFVLMDRMISNRWFCLNQLPSSTSMFSIKHTTHALSRLETSMKMLAYFHKELEHFDGKMKLLAKTPMREQQAIDWFTSLLPAPVQDSQRSLTIHENTRAKFLELLLYGLGTDIPGVRGTAYGALQAFTEWVNHHRSTRVRDGRDAHEVRFEAVNFGSGDTLMQQGVKSLIKIVKP